MFETSKKHCLTVGRRSRELRPLSCDRWVTFFRFFPNCLKRLKALFDSRPTVAWAPTTVAWPFSDFFQKISKLLETCMNVVWQSVDGRVNSDHCRATVEWLFSKNFQIAWNVYKRCLIVGRWSRDLRPQLSRDRSVFFKMLPICLKRRKNVVWQSVGRRSHNLQPLMRDRWATFFKIFLNCLIYRKNFVWKSADSRVTVRLLCYRVCFVRLHISYSRHSVCYLSRF